MYISPFFFLAISHVRDYYRYKRTDQIKKRINQKELLIKGIKIGIFYI